MQRKCGIPRIAQVCLPAVLLLGVLSGCRSALTSSANPLAKEAPTWTAPPATVGPTQQPTTAISLVPSPSPEELASDGEGENMITITIVFDNYPSKAGLQTSWGFAALVVYQDEEVLFDTGGSGSILMANLAALDLNPSDIQAVVLSHEHNDHTGGLGAVLRAGAGPDVYIPPSFSANFRTAYQSAARLINSQPGMKIADRIYTTGQLGSAIPEQALVIDTTQGLIVITGCAHPGVDKMVLEAKRQFKEDIYLVLGGFHLGSASDARVREIIKEFQRIGVDYVAPCHCTGDRAIAMFRNAFGDHFIQVGTGAVIEIENK